MGQKIIQGDLVVSGSISLAPISSDTLVYSLECDKEYTVAWSGRYQIKKIIVNNWGGRVLQVFKKDDKYYYISAAEGQTIGETLEQLNTVNEDQWSCAISANQVGFNNTTVEDTLQALEDETTNIREVAEGKTKTYILDTTWDIQWVLTWLQHNQNISHFTNAQGESLVEAVLSGQYNNVTIANSNFNSQEQTLAIGTAISTEYLIVSTTSKSVYNSPYTVWILDTLDNIFKNGDIILVTQTDVPDRWCGRGVKPTFYALETRKIELPSVNDGKLSIQLGGTEKASFTANQSGDTTLNITKTDITNLGIPSENTWRPVQNNLTSTSTTDALSAAQGKALKDSLDSKIDGSYLYHTLTNGAYYYDSYQGSRGFRIITENMLADTLRWQASTLDNEEYWDYSSSSWKALDLDLSNLFDGDFNTSVGIPYANRKFRFTITANSGWPTTALIILAGSWFDSGTVNNVTGTTYKSIMTIETRSTTSDSWTTKATANFSTQFDGTCGYVNSDLHTGHTLYRITVELGSWTTTKSSASLRNICILSNYAGSSLMPLSFDGTGKVTAKNALAATTLYENGTSLTNKYQSKFTSSNKLSTDYISGLATVATSGSYTDLTDKPTIPSAVTEDTVAGWGFTKNTGTSTFSGSYTDLTNKPTLFSGDYNDLTNKPTIPTEGIINTDLVITSTNQPTWNGKELLTLDDLYRRKEYTAIPINTVTDLNSSIYTNPGIYGGGGDSFTNCPVTGAFVMEVYSTSVPPNDAENVTWSYRFRKLTDYLGNEYIQHCHTAGTAGSWLFGDWKQVVLSDHVHTGYLKGSISDGVLTITE